MEVLVATINYEGVSIADRERYHLNEKVIAATMQRLNQQNSVLENVILSTCNRTELYLVVDEVKRGRYYVRAFLAALFEQSYEQIADQVVFYDNDLAVNHLFEVSTSLASMIVGESQIIGQVKDSFERALQAGTVGMVLKELFKEAITVGKKAQSETLIGAGSVSLSTVAVKLIEQQRGANWQNSRLLILGAGKMSTLVLDYLKPRFQMQQVTLVSRTFDKAALVAARYGVQVAPHEELSKLIASHDVVFCAVKTTGYVLTAQQLKHISQPLKIVDLGLPRNVAPDCEMLAPIERFDLDAIEAVANDNKAQRMAAIADVELLVNEALTHFSQWQLTLKATPVIHRLRTKTLAIYEETMTNLERRLPDLDEHERKVIRKLTKSIVNQIIKEPIIKTKELAVADDATAKLALIEQLFGLETDREEETACEQQ